MHGVSTRIISFLTAAAVFCTVFSGMPARAEETTLSLPQAISLALKNSDGIRKVTLSKVKKQIELKQAYAAIADTRKNESTVRFSLLFNIKFPEKHGMPKEIELLTKVPDIQNEIRILNAEYENARLTAIADCEQQYYTVVADAYDVEYCGNLISEAQSAQKQVRAAYAGGTAKKSDLDYMEKQLSDAQSALSKARSTYERDKEKLSSIIGVDVSKGYKFSCDFPETEISRSMLGDIKDYALKYDYACYKALQNKLNAESSTETVKSVYSGRYGGDASVVMGYLNSCRARGEAVDYEYFINIYHSFLSAIQRPWEGNYVIRLLFFKIKIPKEWFKKTYSGERYLEDERYALFVSLAELDEAEQDRKSAYNTLTSAVTDGFYALGESRSACLSAVGSLGAAESEYSDALADNRKGLVSFTDLYDKKVALLEQQKSIFEMRADYAKSLSAYNLQCAGYISDKLGGSGNSGIKNYEDGVTTGESGSTSEPSWYVTVSGASYKVSFGVNIPDSCDVTDYELYTSDGKQIGKRTAVGKTMTGLSTIYSDTSLLTLKFYRDGALKYTATFDGMQYSGTLDMQSAQSGTQKYTAGSWSVSASGLRSVFSITSDKFTWDSYELYHDGTLIGRGTAAKGVSHLSSTFGDMTGFTVKLYNSGAEQAELSVTATADGQKLLTLI